MPVRMRVLGGALVLACTLVQPSHGADAFFDLQHFSGSANCGLCHNDLFDDQGKEVSIERTWSATMMANASRDPFWQAKFASELERLPGIADALNDKCTRCHAPMANVEASADGVDLVFFGEGFVDPGNPYHDAAMDGVSCTLCHQIADAGDLGTDDRTSGEFIVEHFDDPFERPAYGSYRNPRIEPMRRNSAFEPRYSAHVSSSALCASCHNLKTPVVDDEGNLVEGAVFAEQAIYSEWERSVFADGAAEAESCQECHMARADGVRISNRPRNIAARDGFAQHTFYGGNTLMLNILGANRAALGVGDGDFAAAIEATRATLQSAARLVIEEASIASDTLRLRLRIDNDTGHKLPSGFPSRRAYLHVTVTDAEGGVVFESGAMNPDGSIVGVDADVGLGFEPHYDGVISDGAREVQVYESVMADLDDDMTYTLLRAAGYLKDNRLLPRGFEKDGAPAEIAVIGTAYGDEDFIGGSDRVVYSIALGGAEALNITAELNYQPIGYGFVRDLMYGEDAGPTKGQEDDDIRELPLEVQRFLAMYAASPIRSETITSVSLQLDAPAPGGDDDVTREPIQGGGPTTGGERPGPGSGRGPRWR